MVPIKLKRYENFKLQPYPTFSEALDEFYVRVTAAEKAVAGIDATQIKREAERLKSMVAEQEEAMREDERKKERDKTIGDVIYAHFQELSGLLETFSAVWREGKNLTILASEVAVAKKMGKVPEAFFESFDGKNLSINVCMDELHFSLSLRKSLYENAAEYYDRGKRSKQKMGGVSDALEDSRKKLANT